MISQYQLCRVLQWAKKPFTRTQFCKSLVLVALVGLEQLDLQWKELVREFCENGTIDHVATIEQKAVKRCLDVLS